MISRLPLPCALFLALLAALPLRAARTPAPPLDAFVGEYTHTGEPGNAFSFFVRNGKLTMESARCLPTGLKRIAATVFLDGDDDNRIVFTMGESDKAASVLFFFEPNATFRRTGPPVLRRFHNYVRTVAAIPMRDGVKLHAVILRPADIAAPLPILLDRTPYGVESETGRSLYMQRPELARDGYIFVDEDIRGRYKSRGKFVMMRPLAHPRNPRATDESTDASDTIDWLVANLPGNNGRVGVLGASYDGFLATMAGIDPNPHLKAISPQAPMIDVWLGDDFFHNGAFRQSYGYDYVFDLESTKDWTPDDYGRDGQGLPIDGFDYFLARGSFQRVMKASPAKILPTWKLFLDHPAYDAVWSSRAVENDLHSVAVPTLTVGGYYDQEDMYGPQEEYAKLEPGDAKHENFLVLAPWRHGFWSSSSSRLGNLDFGQPIGDEFRAQIEASFFAHYLKGEPGFTLANTASFQTGSNTWRYYAQFPPSAARPTRLHLASEGRLQWNPPSTTTTVSYVSDPASPVPYRHRPIQPTYSASSQWYDWLTEDQRFVTGRKDLAVYRLPVLQQSLTLTGEAVADIFAATTGSDNDLVVKLIDEYPEDDPNPSMRGYQLMVNAEIFRGRYLSGFDHPQPLVPGSIHEYKFSLHDVDHVFLPGHRILVELQSSWFPLYDRNPQIFVQNIMKARPADFTPETITIETGPGHDSALILPVMPAADKNDSTGG